MQSRNARKLWGNFFIKRSLQLHMIYKIVSSVLITTVISSATMALVYYLKYQTVIVYQLDKVTQELSREHIFFLILPTLLVSFIMNAIIAIGVGMYSSRKYAVPIYKIEQWVSHLAAGKMNALLRFREKEEMKDLSDKCNNLGTTIRDKFLEIKKQTEILAQLKPESQQVNEILSILSTMEIDAMPYEISTNSYTMTKGTRVD